MLSVVEMLSMIELGRPMILNVVEMLVMTVSVKKLGVLAMMLTMMVSVIEVGIPTLLLSLWVF